MVLALTGAHVIMAKTNMTSIIFREKYIEGDIGNVNV
jgi:hypothetical protein